MKFFNRKWVVVFSVLVMVLVILYVTGRKSVHHALVINASPAKVWSVLLDVQSYKEWNPVMKLVEGKIKEGNKVVYQFTQDSRNVSKIPSRVKKVIPNQLLNQGGGIPFILMFNHRYQLEAKGQHTKLIIHEDYRGIWVNFWNPKPVENAYVRLNQAIKQRVESL